MTIRSMILRWARNREPDFVIGGSERPYLKRHWLIPRNRFFNLYVHQFLRSDDDRALHDHPWLFNASWLLAGDYFEHMPHGIARRFQGDWKFRWGRAPHRVELTKIPGWDGNLTPGAICAAEDAERPCWTLFVTGPVVREWGFYCPRGWVHWRIFTAAGDPGSVGKGCEG